MIKESKLIKLFDVAFVPTSYIRGLWKLDSKGTLFPKTEDTFSGSVVDFMNRKITYTGALLLEFIRLGGYYEAARTIYNMIK